jgi:PAS domain S-box-containing protein
MLAEHHGFDFTKRMVRPDGSIRHVRCVGTPSTSGGIFQGFLGTGIDVTEQEQLTQRLRRSRAYLDKAQRLSQTGSFGWKPATGEILWSEETHRIFDLDRTTEPTVEFIVSRTHPEDRASVQQLIARATSEGKDWDLEHRLLMPGGDVKHLRIVARATHDDATGETEFIGAVMDVSQRQRDEAALRRSEEYLKEAQRMTRTGSWACNFITQQLLHASDEVFRIYGFDPADNVGLFERLYDATHPEDEPVVRATLENAIHAGTDFDLNVRILSADGSLRHVRVIGHPFGEAGEYTGITMDVTERKHAEEERDRLRQLEANLAHVTG